MRFALLTTEFAQLRPALSELLDRRGDDIAMLVTSDVYDRHGSLPRQLARNVRRSGATFTSYVTASYVGYHASVAADRWLGLLPGRERRNLSLAEEAERRGIPHLRTGNVNRPEVLEALEDADLDAIVVYWFDQILRDPLIAVPRLGVVNVHAAYLPYCRGLFPVLHARARGVPVGISAHLIDDERVDAGPLLARRLVRLPEGRSVLHSDAAVNAAGVDLLDAVLDDLPGAIAAAVPQGEGTYHSYPTRNEMLAAARKGVAASSLRDAWELWWDASADEVLRDSVLGPVERPDSLPGQAPRHRFPPPLRAAA